MLDKINIVLVGIGGYGPTCVWKAIDFGTAADFACACAARHCTAARIMFSVGAVSMLLGRLELFTMFVLFTPAFWRK